MVGGEDEAILDCYRLARRYHVSPEVFLAMTFSEVELHMRRTYELSQAERSASDDN